VTQLTARPEPLEIDFSRTAVIVVDMQNAFASKGGMLDLYGIDVSGAPRVVEVNRRLLAACRRAGVKVVYLQMTYRPDLSDAGGADSPNYHKELGMVLMRQRPELAGRLLVEGTWDWQIVDALMPQAGDRVVTKTRYSGFSRTGLAEMLRADGIRNLLFTGIATNICVESTARDAYFEEFWPILVEDAMNHAGPDFCRQATLWSFANVFGWVTTSDAIFEALGHA
jgi:ureidoacrylate peracid hydrolase